MSTAEADDGERAVACLDDEQAQQEAARQEAADPERDRFYWNAVCLDGTWYAKRYPRGASGEAGGASREGFWSSVFDVLTGWRSP